MTSKPNFPTEACLGSECSREHDLWIASIPVQNSPKTKSHTHSAQEITSTTTQPREHSRETTCLESNTQLGEDESNICEEEDLVFIREDEYDCLLLNSGKCHGIRCSNQKKHVRIIPSRPPSRPPSSQSPSHSPSSTFRGDTNFPAHQIGQVSPLSSGNSRIIKYFGTSPKPLESQAVSSTPLHMPLQPFAVVIPPLSTAASEISTNLDAELGSPDAKLPERQLEPLESVSSFVSDTFPSPATIPEEVFPSAGDPTPFSFISIPIRRRWSFLGRISAVLSPPETVEDLDSSNKLRYVIPTRSRSISSPQTIPSAPNSPISPLLSRDLSPVAAVCDCLSRLQLDILNRKVIENLNKQLSVITFGSMSQYYRERPNLGEFTINNELIRANYEVVLSNGEVVHDVPSIHRVYSESAADELWRWCNQSVFSFVIAAVDRRVSAKTKGCDSLTVCVSGSRQSYLINLCQREIIATTVVAISTVGCDLQPLELARVTATIEVSLEDETVTQTIHSPDITDLTSDDMLAVADSMVHNRLCTFDDF
eukprot:c57_g1_i1.p1 GENE.c57_g1_i1~~c57_g1_i1.p1  ORF type:complete len:538 (+),score=84.94 c57_g1_i1:37-1650(+)